MPGMPGHLLELVDQHETDSENNTRRHPFRHVGGEVNVPAEIGFRGDRGLRGSPGSIEPGEEYVDGFVLGDIPGRRPCGNRVGPSARGVPRTRAVIDSSPSITCLRSEDRLISLALGTLRACSSVRPDMALRNAVR